MIVDLVWGGEIKAKAQSKGGPRKASCCMGMCTGISGQSRAVLILQSREMVPDVGHRVSKQLPPLWELPRRASRARRQMFLNDSLMRDLWERTWTIRKSSFRNNAAEDGDLAVPLEPWLPLAWAVGATSGLHLGQGGGLGAVGPCFQRRNRVSKLWALPNPTGEGQLGRVKRVWLDMVLCNHPGRVVTA